MHGYEALAVPLDPVDDCVNAELQPGLWCSMAAYLVASMRL
jgi:hypothetical protein